MTTALFCDQCGARLPTSSAKFCPSCGEALERPPVAALSGKSSFAPAPGSSPDEESDLFSASSASNQGVPRHNSNGKNVLAYVAAIVIAVLCVGFYFTPHIAVNSMKSAVEARDAARFSQYVDYPALRESLKRELTAKLVGETQGKNKDPFAAMGASMAAAFIDPAVDKLMTPEGLAMLMAGGKEAPAKRNKKAPGPKAEIDMAMAYESFNKFIVALWEKDKQNDAVQLVFNRDGFFSWKLAAVRM